MTFKTPYKITVCSLAVALALGTGVANAQTWEKDKTYNITILHTNDHHGHFWQNDQGEYGLAAQKRWLIRSAKMSSPKVARCCCCQAVTLIPGFLSLICRMPSLIFVA